MELLKFHSVQNFNASLLYYLFIIFFFGVYVTALVGHLPTDLKGQYGLAGKINGVFYKGEKWTEVVFVYCSSSPYIFLFFPSPFHHEDRTPVLLTLVWTSASSTETHKYNPFYYASNNCTCNSLKSCYNAWTSPGRAFVVVISSTDLHPRVVGPAARPYVCWVFTALRGGRGPRAD